MYAVIQSGGKQYRVAPGDVLEVELLAAPGEAGSAVRFDRVLAVFGDAGDTGDGGFQIGNPVVQGAAVTASFVGAMRGPKIRVFKTKKRIQWRRTAGHRQNLHRVRIDGIELPRSEE
jgi:large subunit ribosomal protein L21